MNSQNFLKFGGRNLNLKLDTSEFHDYEIEKTQGDYNSDVIDFDNSISYSSITVSSTSLLNSDCVRTTINLIEYDNRPNDPLYLYLGLAWTIDYDTFVAHMGNIDTILNNDVYEFELNGNIHYFRITDYNTPLYNPFALSISGFVNTTPVQCLSKLADLSSCCPRDPFITAKPWAYQINHGGGTDNCDYSVARRTEKGWTLDFIFNRETLPWADGNAFYYWGVRNENDQTQYADNNLSFSFTSDGRIEWRKIHYSGYCGTSAYTQSFYVSSGQTPQLCYFGTLDDFNITITFDRYRHLTDCNIENDGGWNDLIPGLKTSSYSDSEVTAVTSTQIAVYSEVEELTKQWDRERNRRLGVLKIYLNGRPIYKVENWEEVVPSTRGSQPFIQLWGSGSKTANGFHDLGTTCFNMKRIKYFEEPLDFVHVKHHYRVDTKPYYDINECNSPCEDDVTGITTNNVNISVEYSSGSVIATYNLVLDKVTDTDVEISFTNTLGVTSGSPIVFNPTITIASGEISGTTTLTDTALYTSLDRTSTISNFTYDALSSSLFEFSPKFIYEFNEIPTPTPTQTPSVTPTSSVTPSITPTNTSSPTSTATPTVTSTNTATPTVTPTNTATPTVTPTNTATPSITPSVTPTSSLPSSPVATLTYLTTTTNVYGNFTNSQEYACSSLDCLKNSTCLSSGSVTVYFSSSTPQVGDYLYSSTSLTTYFSSITGYYIKVDFNDRLNNTFLYYVVNGQISSIDDCNIASPTPTSTSTVTPTPTSTSTVTPTTTVTPTPTSTPVPSYYTAYAIYSHWSTGAIQNDLSLACQTYDCFVSQSCYGGSSSTVYLNDTDLQVGDTVYGNTSLTNPAYLWGGGYFIILVNGTYTLVHLTTNSVIDEIVDCTTITPTPTPTSTVTSTPTPSPTSNDCALVVEGSYSSTDCTLVVEGSYENIDCTLVVDGSSSPIITGSGDLSP